jgi:hypothetical protein
MRTVDIFHLILLSKDDAKIARFFNILNWRASARGRAGDARA